MKYRHITAACAAALMLVPASAAAPPDLAALGYQVGLSVNASTQCKSYHVSGYGADVTFAQLPLGNGSCIADYGVAEQETAMHAFAAGHDARKAAWEAAQAPPPPATDPPPGDPDPELPPDPEPDPIIVALQADVARLSAEVAALTAEVERLRALLEEGSSEAEAMRMTNAILDR